MVKSKDLFDDSTMSFGEHLEALRVHIWKALLGLILTVAVSLYFGDYLVALIREPIDAALQRHGVAAEGTEELKGFNFWQSVQAWFSGSKAATEDSPEGTKKTESASAAAVPETHDDKTILVQIQPSVLVGVLHAHDPEHFPEPIAKEDEQPVSIPIAAREFREFRQTTLDLHRPITLNVQEAFMMYMKVALVGGLVIGSPWIFYQLWLFVAAGLYPHERRYVYFYLPVSVGLFLGGVMFCFYFAMPVVLDFFLGFNRTLGLTAQLRMSEWVSFAIMLPLMFGISFQLPIVMLFLERISLVSVETFRSQRRIAILTISIVAMILTPTPDPTTMMAMFIPLVALYELGIVMCSWNASKGPFEGRQPA